MPENCKDHLNKLHLLGLLQQEIVGCIAAAVFVQVVEIVKVPVACLFIKIQSCSVDLNLTSAICMYLKISLHHLIIILLPQTPLPLPKSHPLRRPRPRPQLTILPRQSKLLLVHQGVVGHALHEVVLAGFRDIKTDVLRILLLLLILLKLALFIELALNHGLQLLYLGQF